MLALKENWRNVTPQQVCWKPQSQSGLLVWVDPNGTDAIVDFPGEGKCVVNICDCEPSNA